MISAYTQQADNPPQQPLTAPDVAGLHLLTRVLGLWFRDPSWTLEQTDTGVPYVHLTDPSGDLSVILARDETGEYGVENWGRWSVPDMTGLSMAALAFGIAKHYTAQWTGIAHIAKRLMREAQPLLEMVL